MLTLEIENEKIEHIFLNEFHSNKAKFFEFIQNSYDKMKKSSTDIEFYENIKSLQEDSMKQTWQNTQDEVWDEL